MQPRRPDNQHKHKYGQHARQQSHPGSAAAFDRDRSKADVDQQADQLGRQHGYSVWSVTVGNPADAGSGDVPAGEMENKLG